MLPLADAVDEIAGSTDFTGVVSVDRGGEIEFAKAYGFAHRGYEIGNTLDTRFAIASGTKGLTALTVMSLVAEGLLELSTPARSVLGKDLPLVDEGVTVEHLLANRSGIGEYYDDDQGDINDYRPPAGPFDLIDTEQYVPLLDGHPRDFPPGEKFSYNNAGFVLLALITERVSGTPFHSLVVDRVCRPAGMTETTFLRSDEPGPRTALGYLNYDGVWRANTFHLPVRGNGDGGIYTTVADFRAFWPALYSGKIVPRSMVREMVRPHSEVPEYSLRYGLGFWLHETKNIVFLEGYDPGVSFRSTHIPETGTTCTVISNYSEGAWPVVKLLAELLG